jgi:hypothetical protein
MQVTSVGRYKNHENGDITRISVRPDGVFKAVGYRGQEVEANFARIYGGALAHAKLLEDELFKDGSGLERLLMPGEDGNLNIKEFVTVALFREVVKRDGDSETVELEPVALIQGPDTQIQECPQSVQA